MDHQKKIFKLTEGNAWFKRNLLQSSEYSENDPIIQAIKLAGIKPKRVLEIGCSNGFRLDGINKEFKSQCYGTDPSAEAIRTGSAKFRKIKLRIGTADSLPFKQSFFDTIIFGFCLYLCDRSDLFKIAYEADRCLSDRGYLIIMDFYPPFPYKNDYSHYKGIDSFKIRYGDMFNWNPAYSEIFNSVFSHSERNFMEMPDERVAVTVLNKNEKSAYLKNPFGGK